MRVKFVRKTGSDSVAISPLSLKMDASLNLGSRSKGVNVRNWMSLIPGVPTRTVQNASPNPRSADAADVRSFDPRNTDANVLIDPRGMAPGAKILDHASKLRDQCSWDHQGSVLLVSSGVQFGPLLLGSVLLGSLLLGSASVNFGSVLLGSLLLGSLLLGSLLLGSLLLGSLLLGSHSWDQCS